MPVLFVAYTTFPHQVDEPQLLIKQLSENLQISQQEFISRAVMEYAKLLPPPTKIATVAIRELIGTLNQGHRIKNLYQTPGKFQ